MRVDPQPLDFVGPERPAATHGLSAYDAAHLKLALRRSIVLVIHDAQDSSNELNSAAWAARSLTRTGADRDVAQRGHDLVMATQQGVPTALGSSPDARLLVDIDLSVLGRPAKRFERYDHDMRKQHAWVPGFRYREGRAKVLQGFLDQPRLYHGEAAAALLESQAGGNLTAALTCTQRRLAQ